MHIRSFVNFVCAYARTLIVPGQSRLLSGDAEVGLDSVCRVQPSYMYIDKAADHLLLLVSLLLP